jgi:hypothetical protein
MKKEGERRGNKHREGKGEGVCRASAVPSQAVAMEDEDLRGGA